jgi:hypothetical protein
MATQTVEFRAATGLTITAKLFSAGSDTEVASVSATEETNRKGTYIATYTDVVAGEYQLLAIASSIPVASWWVTLTLSTATFGVYDKADTRDINTKALDIQSRLPATLDSGNMRSSVQNIAAIADAVWDEAYADHNIAGSFGKLLNTIRKANLAIEGEVTNAITPTTLTFSSNISATTSAYAHAVLLFVDGPLTGENSPIISYNSTNGVFVLEEALTAAPSSGDEFVVIAGSHVHAIADIQSGLATSTGVTAAFTEIKGAGWSSATDTLEEIADAIAGISSGTGGGARTVTITVNDGTNQLQNAKVRVTQGAESYLGTTNASGVVTFNLDDATWTIAITKPGYTYVGTTLVVDGNESATYSMTAVTITPSSTDKVTGYWTVLDENGNAAASVVVTIKARQPLRGGAGIVHDAGERTATSNGSGLIQFTNLIPGWRYAVVANDDYVADFVVPVDAVTSVELGSIVARLP